MGGGGELPYEKAGDVRWTISMKPQKETNLGVAGGLLDP